MSKLLRLDFDEESLLGIPAGPRHNQYSLAQLNAVAQTDGWLVCDFEDKHQPTIHTWRFIGYRRYREQVFVVGPWTDGVTLGEALAEPPSSGRSRRLHLLAMALAALTDRVDFNGPVQGDAVIFTDNGGLLFLPPRVMQRLNGVKSQKVQMASVERYLHPNLTGPDQLAFALGVALYRVLCGRYPFEGQSEEEMHDRIRRLQVVSPATFQPEAPTDLCDAVLGSLGQENRAIPTLTEWKELLGDRPVADALAQLDEPSPSALKAVRIEEVQADRRFARGSFLHRNWRQLLGWGAGAALALAILVPIVGRALAPPVTRGLGPLEVVELFYNSVDVLDIDPMEDAVTSKAGRGLINETMHMFLESRMALANRGGSRILSAQEWNSVGRPEDPPFRVYGITNLQIHQERNEPTPVFVARYFFWTPNIEEITSEAKPPGSVVTERLWLLWTGKDWTIERIELLDREALPTEESSEQGGASS